MSGCKVTVEKDGQVVSEEYLAAGIIGIKTTTENIETGVATFEADIQSIVSTGSEAISVLQATTEMMTSVLKGLPEDARVEIISNISRVLEEYNYE